ncbi:MAG TPA: hypothetical protein VNL95_04550 [Dehalococcoidia bacterium]|nr:hypothetical protein [Dehalococcoidia bacterium]
MSCLPRPLHDPEAERWAVAAALVHAVCDPEALEFYHNTRHLLPAMLQEVKARDFLGALEREAWGAIEELARRDGPGAVNQLTVAHELATRGVRPPLVSKLSEWIAELPTPLLGIHAAHLVRQAAERRRGMERLQEEAEALARGAAPPDFVGSDSPQNPHYVRTRLSGLVRKGVSKR